MYAKFAKLIGKCTEMRMHRDLSGFVRNSLVLIELRLVASNQRFSVLVTAQYKSVIH